MKNFQKSGGAENRNAFRGGSYSLTISVVVLAILIVVNIFASALPTTLTKYDISASKLYSITSNTKVVVNALEQDVTIYWVVQSGQEDEVIENLLGKYDSLSSHIQVVKKNPDVYPTFAEQYTDKTVKNNSLIVECGNRSRFIGYDDIYVQEADIYSYSYNTSFDGEGAITSAIDYVVSEELPQVYILEGHGEASLPASFQGPVALLPDMNSDTITDSLIEENYHPILPISLGLTVTGNSGSGTVTELLTTSYDSYSKLAGYAMTDYEKEDGDIDGPFALAVSIDTAGEGKIVWFASSRFLEDMYNATSSGANNNLGMNALSSLIGETEAMAIRSKSLNYNYLTISDSTASLLKVAMIGVFPLLYLGIGIYVILKRRRLQNEPV